MKLFSFLITTFSDKEGVTRASGTTLAILTLVYSLFIPRGEYNTLKAENDRINSELKANTAATFADFKTNTDRQQRLLWANIAQLRNTLGDHSIYVPTTLEFDRNKNQKP